MKIDFENKKKCYFKDIDIGKIFEYEKKIYLKISDSICFDLINNILADFNNVKNEPNCKLYNSKLILS